MITFDEIHTQLIETVAIPPSWLRLVKGKLRKIYMNLSCLRLSVDLRVSNVKIGKIKTDPNTGQYMPGVKNLIKACCASCC